MENKKEIGNPTRENPKFRGLPLTTKDNPNSKEKEIEFNGYDFDEKNTRKKMKYLVVTNGDLDINNCYAFKNEKELNEYLNENHDKVQAVFRIKEYKK